MTHLAPRHTPFTPTAARFSRFTQVLDYPHAKPSAHLARRTKIIATVGPASWDLGVLEQLVSAGADVFRLNFSHAGPDKQAQTVATIRQAAETVGREVAILGDLPGPKLRIGELRDDYAELETGMHVTLTPRDVEGDQRDDPGLLAGRHRPAGEPARLPRRRRDPPAGRRPGRRRRRRRSRGRRHPLLT